MQSIPELCVCIACIGVEFDAYNAYSVADMLRPITSDGRLVAVVREIIMGEARE